MWWKKSATMDSNEVDGISNVVGGRRGCDGAFSMQSSHDALASSMSVVIPGQKHVAWACASIDDTP